MIVFDVDGVLTDGSINVDADGREIKRFHVRDGVAIKDWMALGGEAGIISGRGGAALRARARDLGIERIVENSISKAADLVAMAEEADIPLEQVAFMGDDLPDLPALRLAGYAMTVADAPRQVKQICQFVTTAPGGAAAAREAIEHLVEARGDMNRWLSRYDG